MTDSLQPWQLGPTELISLALEHLHKPEDINQRLTFLLLDVGVETLFKVYLTLPTRQLPTNIKMDEREQAARGNFHQVCEGVERVAGNLLTKDDLTNVQEFHRARNKLYHDGVGITVPQGNVRRYAELAVHLVKQLLGVNLEGALVAPSSADQRLELERQSQHEAAKATQRTNQELFFARDQLGSTAERAVERIYPDLVKPSFKHSFEDLQKLKLLKQAEESHSDEDPGKQLAVMTPELNRALEFLEKTGQLESYFRSERFIDVYHYYLSLLASNLNPTLTGPVRQPRWAGMYAYAGDFPNDMVIVSKSYGDWGDVDEIPPTLEEYVREGNRLTESLRDANQRIEQLLQDPNFESIAIRPTRRNPRTRTAQHDQGKYDSLQVWFRNQPESETFLEVTFAEIEAVLQSSLPASAYKHREWWANDKTHSQAIAWLESGWLVARKHLKTQTITFQRSKHHMMQPFYRSILDLVKEKRPGLDWNAPNRVSAWWPFRIDPSGFSCIWSFDSRSLQVQLYIDTGTAEQNKRIYGKLFDLRDQIETQLGVGLSWNQLPEKRACRIFASYPAQITESSEKLQLAREWAADVTLKFLDVFQPLIPELKSYDA